MATFAIAIPSAPGERAHPAQAPANETLELVDVEIDRSGMQFPDLWEITENSARLDTDLYSHEHTWSVPRTIPPTGAQATVTVAATDKSGGRVSAKSTIFGFVNIDGDLTAAEVTANADAGAGQPTATATRTVTLTPRGGGPVSVIVRTQDGPDVKFNYRIVTPTTPAPPSSPPPTSPPSTPPPSPAPPQTSPPSASPPAVGFDQPRAYPAPAQGRVRKLTSPVIPLGAPAVGISLRLTDADAQPLLDDVTAAIKEKRRQLAGTICFVVLDFDVDALKADMEEARKQGGLLGEYGHKVLWPFGACVRLVQRLLEYHQSDPGRASDTRRAAASQACSAVGLPIKVRRRQASRGARLVVGRARRTHPRLKARCAKTADGTLSVTVRARKRSARLRDLVGRRLTIGVGRAPAARAGQRGDRLTAVWHASRR